jgi:Flp pilus assembly protein TadG
MLTGESGAVLVEFVLVLPLLLVLLFGMLDFGKAFNYWIDETHLANEGARFAAVNKNPDRRTPGSCGTEARARSRARSRSASTSRPERPRSATPSG